MFRKIRNFLIVVLGLYGALWLYWNFGPNEAEQMTDSLVASVTEAREVIRSVNDVQTARQAGPRFTDLMEKVDRLAKQIEAQRVPTMVARRSQAKLAAAEPVKAELTAEIQRLKARPAIWAELTAKH